jgi:hypothetical protein
MHSDKSRLNAAPATTKSTHATGIVIGSSRLKGQDLETNTRVLSSADANHCGQEIGSSTLPKHF